jgi:hypothetical protein
MGRESEKVKMKIKDGRPREEDRDGKQASEQGLGG